MSENNNNTSESSVYSYSYVSGDEQEHNPNYYEKKDYEKKDYEKKDSEKETKGKKKHGFAVTLGKTAAIALVFGLVSGAVFYGTGYTLDYINGDVKSSEEVTEDLKGNSSNKGGALSATSVSTATTVNDVSDIVENAMPSIVSITNIGEQRINFFGQSLTQNTEGAGSGFIIGQTDDVIYIATNNHVVANATKLTVNFIDNQSVTAEVKGTDAGTDLAVLSVATGDVPKETLKKIKVAALGNSEELRVGEGAVAIGNALGYGQSVTTGVISAMNREVTVEDEYTGTSVTNELIQTSAAINPGNSGGALLNMKGEVIGINSVKYAQTDVEGMGFAIPISQAEPIIRKLIDREVVDEGETAYLGVSGQDVTSQISEAYGMPEGVYVTRVIEDSAAAKAGIQNGDIITGFDGRKVTSMEGLRDDLQYYAAGTTVDMVIRKNQDGEWKEQTLSVTLGRKNG